MFEAESLQEVENETPERRVKKQEFEAGWQEFIKSDDDEKKELIAASLMERLVLKGSSGYDPRIDKPDDTRVKELGRAYTRYLMDGIAMYDGEQGIHPEEALGEFLKLLDKNAFDAKTEPRALEFIREKALKRIHELVEEGAKKEALIIAQRHERYGVLDIEKDHDLFDALTK